MKRFLTAMCLLVLLAIYGSVAGECVFAGVGQTEFVSDFTVFSADSEEDAINILIERGYLPVYSNLAETNHNLDGKYVYVGYKTGGKGSAVTDLVVASSGGSLEMDGCSYKRVSDISLNSGLFCIAL